MVLGAKQHTLFLCGMRREPHSVLCADARQSIKRGRVLAELDDVTDSICYMSDLVSLSDAGLSDLDRALRHERLRRRKAWHTCERCSEAFLGRGDARFCSARCRVAAHRAGKE